MRTLLLACILAVSAYAEDPRVTALLSKGDTEERQHHTKEALSAFRNAEQIEPRNVAVLLRISKQYSDLVESSKKNATLAEQMARKSLEYAKRAVEIDPNNAKARLSLAVGYGKLTDFVGNKTKLEYSKLIKEETEKSIQLDDKDDFAWHVLGRWHFGVANVGTVLKALARVVYGGLPPASNEEAVRCLKKATELAPRKIIHHAALARVYQGMGKPELASKSWQAVIDLPAVDSEDEKDKKEARQVLGK